WSVAVGRCVSAIDPEGRTIWIADAHRGDGKRFVVRGDEKLPAFLELEALVRICTELSRHAGEIFGTISRHQDLNPGEGRFSRQLLSLFQTCSRTINQSGEQKDLFYEKENFTHSNFNKVLVPPLRDGRGISHPTRPCLGRVCACAASASRLPRRLLDGQ